jgi:phospholipid/cholesterol/gamma-HCH transport system substrate-binding protein
MQKRAPTLANILVIGLFALSCFGLLLFLWESFGGPLPLKPKGYRFGVTFQRTLLLAEQSSVRISGVPVGHVISLDPGKDGRTHVVIEMEHQYAPVRANTRVTLRQKTLLGETYVELLPGSRNAPPVREGGQLATSRVVPSVTLDDILTALTPKTRRAFQVWMQSLAAGFEGRGEDLNASFAELEPFVEHANQLVGILASQEGAVQESVHNTGVVFNALAARDNELRGLIVNGDNTFGALAQSSQAFADAFRELPAFEHNSTVALRSLDSFAADASPLLNELRPVELELAPLLQGVKGFSPDFNSLLTNLGPLTKAAKRGLPAVKKQLDLTVPLVENVIPFTKNFNPFLEELSRYVPEIQALLGNATGATEAISQEGGAGGPRLHFLRAMTILNPDSFSVYSQRTGFNRANPYQQPGAFHSLASGLPVFSGSSCPNAIPTMSGPGNAQVPESLIKLLVELNYIKLKGSTPSGVPVPGCTQQGPFTVGGQPKQFPQLPAAKR